MIDQSKRSQSARLALALTVGASLLMVACSDGTNGTGGNGGTGGSGGTGGTGGGGGGPCLAPSTYADLFIVKDEEFCVVGLYESDEVVGTPSSWGRHGGPVTMSAAPAPGSVTIERLTPPAGATGKLTITKVDVDAQIPAMAFVGGQAIDLPFFNWTVVSYTASDLTGEIILVDEATVATRYPVNGFFAGVGVGETGALGRLIYSGLSAVNDAATMTNAFYAADACGTEAAMPRLVPDGDMTCGAPSAIDTFGTASGPVAADRVGNVFVIMSDAGDQEARGYAAEKVARGAAPSAGATLFTASGFAGSLAAIAPGLDEAGVVAFQPIDGTTFDALDVVAQRYRVQSGAIVAEGTSSVLLSPATAGTALPFFTDDQDRLWVAGQRGTDTTVVAVVARAP